MKKILTIVGARPQFIKAAVVSRAFRSVDLYGKEFEEKILHTGQHFDQNMSQVFFEQMDIPQPDFHLSLGGGSHGEMTGRMLIEIEKKILDLAPSLVLIYGDTNSTLAGALAASKLHVPVAHVEAGLRSYNRKMPEEINRVIADQLSSILFCPSEVGAINLSKEGIRSNVFIPGDVMYDAVKYYSERIEIKPKQNKRSSILLTLHRQENVDCPEKLTQIIDVFRELTQKFDVIFPVHPRTKKMCDKLSLKLASFQTVDPLGYFEMLYELKNCTLVATDSGGLQKEAFYMKKPCVVLREETEWTELTESGSNVLCGSDPNKIKSKIEELSQVDFNFKSPYGDGSAGEKIVDHLLRYMRSVS